LCACAAALLSRRGAQFRAGRFPAIQCRAHRINTRSSKRQRIIGKSPSTRSTRRATRSVFSPDGRFLWHDEQSQGEQLFCVLAEDSRPAQLEEIAHVEDPLWRGKYPNPFHYGIFSRVPRSSTCRCCIQRPPPAGSWSSDTSTWTILKEIQGIGPDLQTPALTYDGKYVLVAPFSGFQRLSSALR